MPAILHELVIDARPARVFAALATADGLAAWWPDVVIEGAAGAPGAILESAFAGRAGTVRMLVERVDPDAVVCWRCLGGGAEWTETQVAFELAPDGASRTVLRFSHRGWQSDDGEFARSSYGWARALGALKSLLEPATGEPREA